MSRKKAAELRKQAKLIHADILWFHEMLQDGCPMSPGALATINTCLAELTSIKFLYQPPMLVHMPAEPEVEVDVSFEGPDEYDD